VATNEQQEFLRSLLSRARARTGLKIFKPTTPRTYVDEQRSGSGPDERDPAKLAGLIDKMIINKGWDLQLATGKLRAQWKPIVGDDIAEHVQIEEFNLDASGQSGILVLRADSTAWATQIRLLSSDLKRRIALEVGDGVVKTLKIYGPTQPKQKGLWRVPTMGKKDY
jgi:predicted nucleic acid-binding Zn ribbon protein